MKKVKLLFVLAAIAAASASCAGFPWNKNLPSPPESLSTVSLSAIIVPKDAFDRIDHDNVTLEDAGNIWHSVPSMTIYFKEVKYKRDKSDPLPPEDAVAVRRQLAKYATFFSGFQMRQFDKFGIVVICGEGKIYYGKNLIEVTRKSMTVDGKPVTMPDLTIHDREMLDADKDKYHKVPDVGDVTVSTDGHWYEGVENVSP